MKLINARDGRLQPIPFSLGESGRGRWLEEVKISNRPGQAPDGPEDVSYFVFGEDRKHVILTKANPAQRGVLLRINTEGAYTRGTSGSVKLLGGMAKLLTSGEYAYGGAGRIGGGTDELWHAEGPAIFVVIIGGGSYKGYGHRYLVVTESFGTRLITRETLCQMIATDEEPEVASVARQFKDVLNKDVQAAIKLADELEDSEKPIISVAHFFGYKPMEQVVADHGFAIPMSLRLVDGTIGGVSGVQTGTLVPGDKALVAFSVGRMGGKRYGVTIEAEVGLTRLHVSEDYRGNQGEVLAVVDQPDWHVVLRHFKDGGEYCVVRYDAGGEHRCDPTGKVYQTTPWTGREPVAPPVPEPAAQQETTGSDDESPMAAALRKAGLR